MGFSAKLGRRFKIKIVVSCPALAKPNRNWIPGQTLCSCCFPTNTGLSDCVWLFCRGECKWSTISLKKAGLVHDLIEKISLGNDLVYDLTEIDKRFST